MAATVITAGERETLDVASSFAGTLVPGDVVALTGDLGAGKTVFARGVARTFGVTAEVTSPTFTLIHEYHCSPPLYHMDLYRMDSIDEIRNIGVEDYFYGDGVCLVEWAEKLGELYPAEAIKVEIKHLGGDRREITIERFEKP
jgi:tRNA threonylcarbamoyladenosine biosynthesis protein TsaE